MFRIAQISDLHFGSSRFDDDLKEAVLEEINHDLKPDLLVVAGDLTSAGYLEEFRLAKQFIDSFEVPHVVVIPGNHDARNVGYLHYRDIFGSYEREIALSVDDGFACTIVSVDSSKPDINDGEVGRGAYAGIMDAFRKSDAELKVFVLHHHLIPVPGTGRERNVCWDAGDVLALLRAAGVDLVLAGHRHVPYVWPLADMLVVCSGTPTTWRVRGYVRPSYNILEVEPERIVVRECFPGGGRSISGEYDLTCRWPWERRQEIEERLVRELFGPGGGQQPASS